MNDLLLRPWQMTDAVPLVEIANNPHVYQWLRDSFPTPYTHSDAVQWISHAGKQHPPENFAVESKGILVGSIGFVPGTDIYRQSCEMGYFIGEAYWGSGIATEAVRLLTQYICTLPNMVRIQAKVFSGNLASTRVLEKNGFILEATHQQAVYKNDQLLDEQIWVKLTQASV